jgi:hypothetical protein
MNLRNVLFLIFAISLLSSRSALATPKADTLISEYESLKELTQKLVPDGEVGGLFYFKSFSGYQILWDKNDYTVDGHDTLRILIERNEPLKLFSVTYHYSNYLIPERTVLRRFIGPEDKGWRADTVDVTTLEDLDVQGAQAPRIYESELKILKSYGITLF